MYAPTTTTNSFRNSLGNLYLENKSISDSDSDLKLYCVFNCVVEVVVVVFVVQFRVLRNDIDQTFSHVVFW